MCIICVEFARDRISIQEARRNLTEMVVGMDDEHVEEVEEMLKEAEAKTGDKNED